MISSKLYMTADQHPACAGKYSRVSQLGVDFLMCLLAKGSNLFKGGVWCQRISQTPFDSQEQLYLNKAKIRGENPSNLLIPISVFGLRDSGVLLICFCLSEAAGGFQTVTLSEIQSGHVVRAHHTMTDVPERGRPFKLKFIFLNSVSQKGSTDVCNHKESFQLLRTRSYMTFTLGHTNRSAEITVALHWCPIFMWDGVQDSPPEPKPRICLMHIKARCLSSPAPLNSFNCILVSSLVQPPILTLSAALLHFCFHCVKLSCPWGWNLAQTCSTDFRHGARASTKQKFLTDFFSSYRNKYRVMGYRAVFLAGGRIQRLRYLTQSCNTPSEGQRFDDIMLLAWGGRKQNWRERRSTTTGRKHGSLKMMSS